MNKKFRLSTFFFCTVQGIANFFTFAKVVLSGARNKIFQNQPLKKLNV